MSRQFSRYFRPCPYSEIDLYRVFLIFGISNPAIQHAIKKLAFAGQRGGKDYEQDIREAIAAAERAIELRNEDALHEPLDKPQVAEHLSEAWQRIQDLHDGVVSKAKPIQRATFAGPDPQQWAGKNEYLDALQVRNPGV